MYTLPLLSPSWNNVQLENVRDSALNDWSGQKMLPQKPLGAPVVPPSLLTPHKPLERTAEKTSTEATRTLAKLKAANTLKELKQKSLLNSPRPLEHTAPRTSLGKLSALEQFLAGEIDAITSEQLKQELKVSSDQNLNADYELRIKEWAHLTPEVILGQFLNIARTSKGWGQHELARETQKIVNQSTISRAEKGLHTITAKNLLALAKVLNNSNLNRYVLFFLEYQESLKIKIDSINDEPKCPSLREDRPSMPISRTSRLPDSLLSSSSCGLPSTIVEKQVTPLSVDVTLPSDMPTQSALELASPALELASPALELAAPALELAAPALELAAPNVSGDEPLGAPEVPAAIPALLTPHGSLERTREKTSKETASPLEKLKAANTLEKLKQELNKLAPRMLVNNDSFYKILEKKAPLLGDRVILGLFLKIARKQMFCASGRRMAQGTLAQQSNVKQAAISRAEHGKKSKDITLLGLLKILNNQNINQFILKSSSSSFPEKLKNEIRKMDCSLIHPEVDLSTINLESEDTNKPKQSLPNSPRPLEHTAPKTSSGTLSALEQLLAGGIDAMTSEGLKKIHTKELGFSCSQLEEISGVSQKTIYNAEQDITSLSDELKEKILDGIKEIVKADARGIKRKRIFWDTGKKSKRPAQESANLGKPADFKGIKRKLTLLKGEETPEHPARKSAKLDQSIVIDKKHSSPRAISSATLSTSASSRGVCSFPNGNELPLPPGVNLSDELLLEASFPRLPLPPLE